MRPAPEMLGKRTGVMNVTITRGICHMLAKGDAGETLCVAPEDELELVIG